MKTAIVREYSPKIPLREITDELAISQRSLKSGILRKYLGSYSIIRNAISNIGTIYFFKSVIDFCSFITKKYDRKSMLEQ